ncbi:NADH-quinone oxidoreductase subunit L [Stratiformator vulcanicus]|nr:NADH-quinone oxidoreductase subunit L [Stratiformator vulcanicus]
MSWIGGTFFNLAKFGDIKIVIDCYIDFLTIVMFLIVTLVSLCVHVFSLGYMDDELTDEFTDHEVDVDGNHLHRRGRFDRFFAFLGLFSFAMMGLVISGNLFQTFVFWELVGATSYFLIGFYQEREYASSAANKAFIMNRIGDAGFLIGMALLFHASGSLNYEPVFRFAPGIASTLRLTETGPWLTIAGLGIFAGCVGKSAQFPLQTWLKDAMAGPTPVSALVHSATMVAAGVFLIARVYPIFTEDVLAIITYCGLTTLIIGAIAAVFQNDIKRILAYSTISQLGYMVFALGIGGWTAGVLHLITHAFFKSLLFLGAGSVIHACHHEQNVTRLGGLWRKMPITAGTMLIGTIAISGLAVPLFGLFEMEFFGLSGFHSKDAILITAYGSMEKQPLYFWIPLCGAGITAFYMFRLWFLTFVGSARSEASEHARESSSWMTLPLVLLALCSVFVGWEGEEGELAGVLSHAVIADHGFAEFGEHAHGNVPLLGIVSALIGTVAAGVLFAFPALLGDKVFAILGPLRAFFASGWGFDRLYAAVFVGPVKTLGWIVAMLDEHLIDQVIHGLARSVKWVARLDRKFDEIFIDGAVNGVATVAMSCGRAARELQTGMLRQYVMFIAAGLILLVSLASIFLLA